MKNCNQCGKCCINYSDGGLVASHEEIDLWQLFNPAIAQYVNNGQIWIDPDSGMRLKRCPWLGETGDGRYYCMIYEDRPADCRHYPVTIEQMLKDECEMLEVQDLTNPRHAQVQLDSLMSNDR
ncbi:MAG: YkgJ family cysteine cluster protein [Pseudomonadota bacterium]